MDADNSFYVKFIATFAPTFFGYIILVLDMVAACTPNLQEMIPYYCYKLSCALYSFNCIELTLFTRDTLWIIPLVLLMQQSEVYALCIP